MSNKQKAFAVLGALMLAEAFLDRAVSKAAKAAGVNGAQLAIAGMVATALAAKLD